MRAGLAADADSPELDEILSAISGVDGWLTDDQARLLWDRARVLPAGARVVEIGNFRGRSTIVLARAAPHAAEIVAIDPHAGSDRGPQEIEAEPKRGAEDHAAFHANVRAAGVDNHVRHVRKLSQDAGDDVHGNLDLLYIDGTHRYAPALSDMRQWGSRVVIGGTMFVHDAFCSIGVTRAIARELLFSHTFSYRGRVGSLAEYRREPVEGKRRVRNISRQLVEGPWFARGLLVKLLITLKLRPLTRLLGNRLPWPY